MTPPAAAPRFNWHTIVIVLLTVGLLWLFLRGINFREVLDAMKGARWSLVAAAVLVTLQTYVLRTWRWQALLQPLGGAAFRPAFRTTVIGFASSFLVSSRLGDVLRPYLLARREGLHPGATFATIIIERLLDLTSVMMLFGVAILASGVDVGREVKLAGAVVGAIALAGLAMLALLAGHPERLASWTAAIVRILPAKLAALLEHFVRMFAEGLKVMRSPAQLALAAAWSIPLWLSIALGIYLTTRAFDLTMSFVGSFIVVGYLTVGVAVPTPGGAGSFHYFYKLALTQFFGAADSPAGAAAIVLHGVSFVPVTILGLFYLWQDGLTLGRLRNMKDEATDAERS